MQQITRRAIPRKRFGNLPARPFSCGMRRHVEVHGVTSMVTQYYEDIQQAKVVTDCTDNDAGSIAVGACFCFAR